MCEVKTLEQMMDEKFTSDVSEEVEGEEEDEGERSELVAKFLSALEGMETLRKYLMKFDVSVNMMAALSSIENDVYRVQQKAMKQRTIIIMWKK
jgi:hypothetical protein